MTRSNAREIAMHLIFEMEYHDELPEELMALVFSPDYYPTLAQECELYAQRPGPEAMRFIENCVRGVYAKKPEIDEAIARYAVGWKLSRISKVSLAVLRLAIFEILQGEDAGVAINEAVEIARRYEEEEKVAFINGILGTFTRAQA